VFSAFSLLFVFDDVFFMRGGEEREREGSLLAFSFVCKFD